MHLEKHVPLGDLIYLDRERCIQCARCIRFQDEIAGDPVLGFDERGRGMEIVTFSDPGFDSVLLRQHHRHLPGRRADHRRLPLRGAPLGAEHGGLDLPALPGRLQHHAERPPRATRRRRDRRSSA